LIGRLLADIAGSAEQAGSEALLSAPAAAAQSVAVRGVIDGLSDPIAVLDSAGRIMAVNQAWLQAPGPFGRKDLPRVREPYLELWQRARSPAASEIARGLQEVVEGAQDGFRARFRTSRPARWFELGVQRLNLKRAFELLVVHRDVTQSELSNRALRLLSRRLVRAQEAERRRIARDLHGQTAQNLTAISLALARAEPLLGASEAGRALLRETRELAERSVAEIRTLSYLLHPPLLDEEGLASAVHWYVTGFAKRSGIRTDLRFSDNFGRLPRDVELALFAVIQECLSNVYRHSGSGTARIELRRDSRQAVVEVSNDGRGPSSEQREAMRKASGLGIRGVRERLHAVGGSFELRPRGKGLTAIARVPLASRRSHANPDRR
jgi:signal transduction histidine kinase